jgi:UDP-2-acetamido-2,6-beta-L-arabino-hexul-4-ose reductase
VIVHLAAMNRHNDPQVIYDDVGLAAKLVLALEATNSKAHLFLFSQEERDNLYGKSKRNEYYCIGQKSAKSHLRV